jgi:hypothetical protein
LTISLHWSLFVALSVQPLIPIFLRSSVTSSVYLNVGLPIFLFVYSFPFSTLSTDTHTGSKSVITSPDGSQSFCIHSQDGLFHRQVIRAKNSS